MKKRMLKIIAGVMSFVIICLSMATGACALDSTDGIVVDELSGYTVYHALANESETAALLLLQGEEDYINDFAFTVNGTDYEVFDFDGYAAQGSDYYEIATLQVKGDMFVFLLKSYQINYGDYIDEYEGYDEEYVLVETKILTTADCKTFKEYIFESPASDEMIYNDDLLFYELGVFSYIGDTWVYANTDYIITKETDEAVYGKGVYYTTKDFINWTAHYTPEKVFGDYECIYYDGFSIVGDNLIVEHWQYFEEHEYITWRLDETNMTNDFSKYVCIYDGRDSVQLHYPQYYIPDSESGIVYRIESLCEDGMVTGDTDAIFQVVKVNTSIGDESQIYESFYDPYWSTVELGDTFYFVMEDEEGFITYNYVTDEGLFEEIDLGKEDVWVYFSYVIDERIYSINETSLWVIEDTDAREYDISSFISDTTTAFAFTLNHELFIIEAPYESDVKVYVTGAEIGKLGDVNLDDKISSLDALSVLQCATGLIELGEDGEYRADVNKDGTLNSSDALEVLQYSTGLITNF